MRARALFAIAAVVVIALAVYWFTHRGGDGKTPSVGRPGTSVSSATTTSRRSASVAPDARAPGPPRPVHTAAERAAMLEAIAIARSHRTAGRAGLTGPVGGTRGSDSTGTTLNIVDRTGDTSDWSKRTLDTLDTLLGQCYDLGRAEDPKLEGTVMLRFTLVGEPNVGGLLERVEIVDENTSIKQQTIRDCMTEQLYALELDPPPDGVRIERQLSLQFP